MVPNVAVRLDGRPSVWRINGSVGGKFLLPDLETGMGRNMAQPSAFVQAFRAGTQRSISDCEPGKLFGFSGINDRLPFPVLIG